MTLYAVLSLEWIIANKNILEYERAASCCHFYLAMATVSVTYCHCNVPFRAHFNLIVESFPFLYISRFIFSPFINVHCHFIPSVPGHSVRIQFRGEPVFHTYTYMKKWQIASTKPKITNNKCFSTTIHFVRFGMQYQRLCQVKRIWIILVTENSFNRFVLFWKCHPHIIHEHCYNLQNIWNKLRSEYHVPYAFCFLAVFVLENFTLKWNISQKPAWLFQIQPNFVLLEYNRNCFNPIHYFQLMSGPLTDLILRQRYFLCFWYVPYCFASSIWCAIAYRSGKSVVCLHALMIIWNLNFIWNKHRNRILSFLCELSMCLEFG